MPFVVNGKLVTEENVLQQEERLRNDPKFQRMADESARRRQLRTAAEVAAIDVIIVEQLAENDPRPIDPHAVGRELERQRRMGNCRSAAQESRLRVWIERDFRLQRVAQEMTGGVPMPTSEDIEAFYAANRTNFRGSAIFRAAHIVKHTNSGQNEEQAKAGIEAALAELEDGAAFSQVADRHSDCPGKGGDLGEFLAGTMVQEFEDAIRELKPGERTGVFRTPFGFHIAELRGKTPAGTVALEEVRDDIRRVLLLMRQHQEYLRVMAELRSRSDIRWIESEASERRHEPRQTANPL